MLKDLVDDKFKKLVDENPNIIFDNYNLKNGIYIKLDHRKSIEENLKEFNERHVIISRNKEIENKELYRWFKKRDYYSDLFDMQKPVDSKKQILSTNSFTIFIKKEKIFGNKVKFHNTQELVGHLNKYYYPNLATDRRQEKLLELKGKVESRTKKDKEKIEELNNVIKNKFKHLFDYLKNEQINEEKLKCQNFITNNLDKLYDKLDEVQNKYDFYIKIFFEVPVEYYQQDYYTYATSVIFNKNDHNKIKDGNVFGVCDVNYNLNESKPSLKNLSFKNEISQLVSIEDAFYIKDFATFLSNQKHNFKMGYDGVLDKQNESNHYITYTSKNGKPIITGYDNVPFKVDENESFEWVNVLNTKEKLGDEYVIKSYKSPEDLKTIKWLINKYFFDGHVKYFSENEELDKRNNNNISKLMHDTFINSRKAFDDWFNKGTKLSIKPQIDKITFNLMEDKLNRLPLTKLYKIQDIFNLRISLLIHFNIKGGLELSKTLKELTNKVDKKINGESFIDCESDTEFYYIVGQLIHYIISKSKTKTKNYNLISPITKARNTDQIKENLFRLFKKYEYAIPINYKKFGRMYAMISSYEPSNYRIEKRYRDYLIAGLTSDNLLMKPKNNENKQNEESVYND